MTVTKNQWILLAAGAVAIIAVVGCASLCFHRSMHYRNGGFGTYGRAMHAADIAQMPKQDISDAERTSLVHMREEEKLAHDVYVTLNKKWELRVFANITRSEQVHTDAIKALLEKYDIPDPVTDTAVGAFTDPAMQKLYGELTGKGELSVMDALAVGATIEDLDIADLQKALETVDNEDIQAVYAHLKQGSENHMRAFVGQLTARDATYAPQYISQKDFTAILSADSREGNGNGGRGGKAW